MSRCYGTGGRDLKDEVGAITALDAIDRLAADDGTDVILCVSKPPAPAVAERVLRALAGCGTPAVACFVGGGVEPRRGRAPGRRDAGGGGLRRGAPRRRGRPGARRPAGRTGWRAASCAACSRAARSAARPRRSWPSGWARCRPTRRPGRPRRLEGEPHGARLPRPGRGGVHPRTAPPDDRPGARAERFAIEAADPAVGVLLIDVVLGYASHPDPAGVLAPAVREALAARPELAVVGYVLGTDADPQVAQPPGGDAARGRRAPGPHQRRRRPARRRPRRVRIRLVTYSTKPRGGVVHALSLAEALGDRGHDVELWALSADGAGFFREPRVPVRLVPVERRPGEDVEPRILRYAATLADGMRDAGPADVHHSEDCLSARSMLALRAEGLRAVGRPDDPPRRRLREPGAGRVPARLDRGRRPPRLREPLLGRASSRATTASRATVIPNGVDGERFADCPLDRAAAGRAARLGRPADGARRRRHRAAQGQPHPARGLRAGAAGGSARARCWPIAGGETLFDYADYRDAWERDAARLGLRVHRGPAPPAGRRRRRARPDRRRRHAGPLPRGRRCSRSPPSGRASAWWCWRRWPRACRSW